MKKADEKLLVALLESNSISEAATRAGVGRPTIYRKLENAEFRREYDKQRSMLVTTAGTRLCGLLGSALDIIREVATDAGNAPQVRLNAAQIILNTAIRLHEQIDIKQKVEEIERRLNYAIER